MKHYIVTLRSGSIFHLIAPNSEHAAWSALELSQERNDKLINISLAYEW